MKFGLSYSSDLCIWNLSIRSYGFTWVPGEEESGNSYPAQYLDVPYGDKYWVYSWLCFVFFIVRPRC